MENEEKKSCICKCDLNSANEFTVKGVKNDEGHWEIKFECKPCDEEDASSCC
ncbi:MAG: hypothetical protein GXO83_01895 [Chlorobi bacterium]|nr:hypothetical protein [Chlorobiota bacterium]